VTAGAGRTLRLTLEDAGQRADPVFFSGLRRLIGTGRSDPAPGASNRWQTAQHAQVWLSSASSLAGSTGFARW